MTEYSTTILFLYKLKLREFITDKMKVHICHTVHIPRVVRGNLLKAHASSEPYKGKVSTNTAYDMLYTEWRDVDAHYIEMNIIFGRNLCIIGLITDAGNPK